MTYDDAMRRPLARVDYPSLSETTLSEDGFIVDWAVDWDGGVTWCEVEALGWREQGILWVRG